MMLSRKTSVSQQLRILAPTRYLWTFNGPRHSRHQIIRRSFLPTNKISPKREGVTVFLTPPWQRVDLVHAFNRIPITTSPYIIGFESHLPRAFGLETTRYYRLLRSRLVSAQCRRIIAISRHAKNFFHHFHGGSPEFEELERKLEVRFPNIDIPDLAPDRETSLMDRSHTPDGAALKLVFVGNHFARKGGCVAVRVAEIANERRCPIHVSIVSSLQVGAQTWTDPLDPDFFTPYYKLFDLPNVRFCKSLPNEEVLQILRSADFSLLATVADTFGFSAIESLANATPVIATRQGALPEFLRHGEDSILLDQDVNEFGYWKYSSHPERGTKKFEKLFRDEVERLAQETYAALEPLVGDHGTIARMRLEARRTAIAHFDADRATEYWDSVYEQSVANPRTQAA